MVGSSPAMASVATAIASAALGVLLERTLYRRLYGASHLDQVLSVPAQVLRLGIPLIFLVLGIFVSFMQAFIFTLLTAVYISGAVAQEH